VSKSGVTIAIGFDLGQRSEADLRKLNLSAPLLAKLRPYLGKKKAEAQTLLQQKPLTIASSEAMEIDKAAKKSHVESLRTGYVGSPHNLGRKDFFALPAEAQTVIASLSFQYGTNLSVRAPKFWQAVCEQNWAEAVKVLNNFGDAYSGRRR
jgi:Bacterial toxin homologue of phage lysozyme, C-term